MRRFRILPLLLALGSALVVAPIVVARDGPEQEIEELTERMKQEGESADLLLQRALEYNVLSKSAEAAKDLERSVELDASSVTAQRELSRTYLTQGKTNEALAAVTRALKRTADGQDSAILLITRAEILLARNENQKALDDAERAIREHANNAEWYLVRSRLHARLKQKKERIQGLEQGLEQTGAGILLGEWVDALIEDGQAERALPKIEAELASSRLQSSWWIRRAKVRLAKGMKEEATKDLEAALAELNHRIQTATPEPALLADRGLAQDLLGLKEEARKDYESARDKGVTDDALRERIRALRRAANADAEEEPK